MYATGRDRAAVFASSPMLTNITKRFTEIVFEIYSCPAPSGLQEDPDNESGYSLIERYSGVSRCLFVFFIYFALVFYTITKNVSSVYLHARSIPVSSATCGCSISRHNEHMNRTQRFDGRVSSHFNSGTVLSNYDNKHNFAGYQVHNIIADYEMYAMYLGFV